MLTSSAESPISLRAIKVGPLYYGVEADLWSLGALLFELLTLKRPFESDSFGSLIQMIMQAGITQQPFTPPLGWGNRLCGALSYTRPPVHSTKAPRRGNICLTACACMLTWPLALPTLSRRATCKRHLPSAATHRS